MKRIQIVTWALGLICMFHFTKCRQPNRIKEGSKTAINQITHHDSIIINAGQSFPDFEGKQLQQNCLREILTVQKQVYVKFEGRRKGGVDLKLHKFTCNGGQSCPDKIIYVSDDNGFEYAFPFFDCNYCRSDSCNKAVEAIYKLNDHLKKIVTGLKLNENTFGDASMDYYEFISMLAGDFLGMRELRVSDTISIMQAFTTPRKKAQTGKMRKVSPKVKQNIEGIIRGLKKGEGTYYASNEGFGAFYKFSIYKENGQQFIKAEYLNREGHEGLYF